MKLFLLDPADPGPAWAPFSGVRPIAELRVGMLRVRERWERILGRPTDGVIAGHTAEALDVDAAPVVPVTDVVGPAWVVDARSAPTLDTVAPSPADGRLTMRGRTVAWTLADGQAWSGPHEDGAGREIDGILMTQAADLLDGIEALLPGDIAHTSPPTRDIPSGSIVLGSPDQVSLRDAIIEPGVVFDTRNGPIAIDHAEVRHGTRLEGPLYVAPGSIMVGGLVRRSVVGPQCRVRGEVASTVFLGYANKAHDGFVGHSVIGHWANLGALTTTSNLKNTYGAVRLEWQGHRWDTDRQFLGSLIGDHAKTAIGTMLGTGTIIGAGANVFGSAAIPKDIAPFAWGATGAERMSLEGFLTVAERVLPRRAVEWTDDRAAGLAALYQRLTR
jgi:UDP-N-acetylglucosamine diphosphorylase/glucosamine-1-phosphate N-acetyltransferase